MSYSLQSGALIDRKPPFSQDSLALISIIFYRRNLDDVDMASIELTASPGPDAAPSATTKRSLAVARCRITISYMWRHRRLPNLEAPTRFTELV